MNIIWKILLVLFLIPLIYVIGCIVYAKVTYYDPPQLLILADNPAALPIQEKELTAMIWNIGYGGLGSRADFFKDGGTMTRPNEQDFEEYFDGIMNALDTDTSDFQMLQEVDSFSKRSYLQDEVSFIKAQAHSVYPYTYFATNYLVKFVPVPFLDPMGNVHSGLLNLSRFKPYRVERHQLPGQFGFPDQLFFLRRCLLVSYYKTTAGKDFVMINVHNSAYDEDGKLKAQEMAYLKDFIEGQVELGRYVLCGGDWNQCPPKFPYNKLAAGKEGDYLQTNVDPNFLSKGSWAFDPTVPTNRKNDKPFHQDKTFVTIIDFFWHSENIAVSQVATKEQLFRYSDHQPVKIKFTLQ